MRFLKVRIRKISVYVYACPHVYMPKILEECTLRQLLMKVISQQTDMAAFPFSLSHPLILSPPEPPQHSSHTSLCHSRIYEDTPALRMFH